MKIKATDLPDHLLRLIKNPDPLAGEDLIIEEDDGAVVGVILQPNAYEFFLSQVRAREDGIDECVNEPYDKNAVTLDDLIKDTEPFIEVDRSE